MNNTIKKYIDNSNGKPVFPALQKSSYILNKIILLSNWMCVYLGTNVETNQQCCIKIVLNNSINNGVKTFHNLEREIEIYKYIKFIRTLDSRAENIVQFVDHLKDDQFIYLITNYCKDGDLFNYIYYSNHFPESYIKPIFKTLLDTIQCLHDYGISHSDLALENIGIEINSNNKNSKNDKNNSSNNNINQISIFLLDFSASHTIWDIRNPNNVNNNQIYSYTSNNTNHYVNPIPNEIFKCETKQELLNAVSEWKKLYPWIIKPNTFSLIPGREQIMSPDVFYNQMSWNPCSNDLYACGVLLYIMLTKRYPYTTPHTDCLWFEIIYSGRWKLDELRNKDPEAKKTYGFLSDQVIDLIDWIIKPVTKTIQGQRNRITWDEIWQHPWLV